MCTYYDIPPFEYRRQAVRTCRSINQHALPVALLVYLLLIISRSSEAAVVLPGHERTLEVPRIDPSQELVVSPPTIDGFLGDPVWRLANSSTGFWSSLEDKPPSNQTEVLVMMDNEYLYFGFRMYDDKPQEIQSTTIVRDVGLGYDDSITIELDTFFNRRDISKFSLNPAGTQDDEIAGGRSAKIEWKGDWLGAATRTSYGWSAEFAIPFRILNYNSSDTRFGVNFKRYQSRTKEYSYWADVTPQALNEEMGQLTGLVLAPARGDKAWTFMPFALAGKDIPNKKGEVKDTLVTGGIDMRYQPRRDLTGLIALNPDFSQVEQAVTDISFSYTEKKVKDNRPFFVEGKGYFGSDDEYFYSNRVPDFNAGGKGFGRTGRTQYGLLLTEAPDERVDFVGRALYEIDERNSTSTTVIGSRQQEFNNLFALAQFGGRQRSGLNYSLNAAVTNTTNVSDPSVPQGTGSHFDGSLGWQWDYAYISGTGDKYDTDYFPADALLDDDLPGTRGVSFTTGYYREMSHPLWHVINAYVGGNYRETSDGMKQQQKSFASGSVEFNIDVRVTAYAEVGPYRPVSDTRGVFESETNHDRYYSMLTEFATRNTRYSGGLQYDWGNLGGGSYKYYAAYGWWRPVQPLYLELSAERVNSFGTNDQVVLVTSWDITPEHSLGGRYIYTDDAKFYRLAYSHRPRKGLDIFAVFDDDTTKAWEFSVKVVKTF
jgi:hypothetical protein